MKLYLIRHGQTDWNTVKRLQGTVNIPLNNEGIKLAQVTAKGLESVDFDLIYSSPLDRARKTADIIRGDRDIPVIEDDRIREMSFGKYEGCLAKENPDIWVLFEHPEKYVAPEDGETLEELCTRTADFLKDLINNRELTDKTILISTHGAALRGLLMAVKKTEMSDFWAGGVHKNCAVTVVECINGNISIVEEAKTFY